MKQFNCDDSNLSSLEVNNLATSVIDLGRLIDEVSACLMYLSLRGLQYSLVSDLHNLEQKTPIEISEIAESELESELISIFQQRIAKIKEYLGG